MIIKIVYSIVIILLSFSVFVNAEADNAICFGYDEDYKSIYPDLHSPLRSSINSKVDNWVTITSKWDQPRNSGSTPHQGIDLNAKLGTPVFPIAGGIVRAISSTSPVNAETSNNYVIVQLDIDNNGIYDNVFFVAMHLNEVNKDLNIDTPVNFYTELGTTGKYYGVAHLHWGITDSATTYENLRWYPAQKYYSYSWNNGKDLDLVSTLDFSPTNNMLSVFACIMSDGGFEAPKEVRLFYRKHGTTMWRSGLMTSSDNKYFKFDLTPYFNDDEVDILVRVERNVTCDYQYGFFPAKYYRPTNGDPNATGFNCTYYTVKVQNFESLVLGQVRGISGTTGSSKTFKVNILSNGVYTFETFYNYSSCNTVLTLFNSQNIEIASDRNSGFDGYSLIRKQLPTGVYYLKVAEESGGSLDCKLSFTLNNNAYEIVGEDSLKKLNFSPGTRKIYQVNVTSAATYTFETFLYNYLCDTEIHLYNSNWDKLETAYDEGFGTLSKMVKSLPVGTYYVEICASRFTDSLNCYFGYKKIPIITGVASNNVNLPIGSTDTYQLNISSSIKEMYGFEAYCTTNVDIYIYDEYFHKLASYDQGDNPIATIVRSLTAGTYYIVVREHNNDAPLNYRLKISKVPAVVLNQTYPISLPAGDTALFWFKPPVSGNYLIETARSTFDCDTALSVYNPGYDILQYSNDDADNTPYAMVAGGFSTAGSIIRVGANSTVQPVDCLLKVQSIETISLEDVKTIDLPAGQAKTYWLNIASGQYVLETASTAVDSATDISICETRAFTNLSGAEVRNELNSYSRIISTLSTGNYVVRVKERNANSPLSCKLLITPLGHYDSDTAMKFKIPLGFGRVYDLSIVSSGTYTLDAISYSQGVNTEFYLYDNSWQLINYSNDYLFSHAKMIATLAPGEYHCVIRDYGNDDAFDCYLSAQGVKEATNLLQIASPTGVPATYHLVITEATAYVLETSFSSVDCDTELSIYQLGIDENLQRVAVDDDSGVGLYSRIVDNLSVGEYYLEVNSINETPVNCFLSINKVASINLGSTVSISQPVGGTVTLKFFATNDAYDITTSFLQNDCDTELWLYDAEWNLVAYDDNAGDNNFSKITRLLSLEDYYITLKEKGNDHPLQCNLQITYTPDIKVGDVKSINLPAGSSQIYHWNLLADGYYVLETAANGGSCNTQFNLYILGTTNIGSDDDSGEGLYSKLRKSLYAENYLIKLSESGNDSTLNCKFNIHEITDVYNDRPLSVSIPANGFAKTYELYAFTSNAYVIATNSSAVDMYLYDSAWQQLSYVRGVNSRSMQTTLNAGSTYYIEVRDNGTKTAPISCNLSVSTVNPIAVGETKTISAIPGLTQLYKLSVASRDSFSIQTSYSGLACDTVLELYDSNWNLITSNDTYIASNYARINRLLNPGMYYILVKSRSTSESLKCDLKVIRLEDLSLDGIDEVDIPAGFAQDYHLLIYENNSYKLATLYTTRYFSACDTVLTLYDASWNQLDTNDDGTNPPYAELLKSLAPGEYHLRITESGNNAPIQCWVSVEKDGPQELIIDGASQYIDLPVGESQTYLINVQDFGTYCFDTSANTTVCDTVLTLTDGSGNVLARNDDSVGMNSLIYLPLAEGMYYLKIEEEGNDHNLNCAVSAQNCSSSLNLLNIGGPAYFINNPSGQSAVYALSVDLGDTFTLATSYNMEPCDTVLTVYNLYGNVILQNDDTAMSTFAEIRGFLSTGEYVVEVREISGIEPLNCYLSIWSSSNPSSNDPTDPRL